MYYARSIDACMLPDINKISAYPTEDTNKKCTILMAYTHSYPNAVIRYYASDMRLYIYSDAAYFVMPNAKSRGAGHFYLRNYPTNPVNPLVK